MEFRNGTLQIGGVSVNDLVERFGTPAYIYDASLIVGQIAKVRRAFSALPLRPFYAMKANSNVALLRLIRENGFGCDAVSPGEIFLAEHAGYLPQEIWFTCSNVSDDDLLAIPDPHIVINVNSMSEIDRCLRLELPNPIALRVNPDVGAGHHVDVVTAGSGVKFGIDVAEIDDARMVVEDSGREVVGLHAHIGSGIDSIEPLLQSAQTLIELAPEFNNLRWINFGGGIGVPYRPGEREFPIDEYGRGLARVAGDYLQARALYAILEPGRYVVASSGVLISRVTSRKISAGTDWIGCDTGFNHLVRPSKYGAYHHIVNATRGSTASLRETFDDSKMTDDVVVAGNLCESGDVFTRDSDGNPMTRHIDRTRVGDLIAFCEAGAYGFSMGSHYNARLMPPEVLTTDGKFELIRERQSFDDLIRGME
ncbi:MAG TPA: diaminopimelate decarboxylase [Thermoanaerobaculia bacterium]